MESGNTNQFNIYDIFYFFKRNYIKIIILTFVSVSIGALLILKTKPLYSSHAEIEIEEGDGALTSNWFEGFSEDRKLEDKVATLKSRTIAESTIAKLIKPENKQMYILDTKRYEPVGLRKTFNGILTLWGVFSNPQNIFSKDYIFTEGDIRSFVKKLQKSLSIEHLKETSHLQISVKSLDSKEAAEIVDSLIVAYSEEEIKHANSRSSEQIKFLKNEILSNDGLLLEIDNKIESFQVSEDMLNEDGNADLYRQEYLNLRREKITIELRLKDFKNTQVFYQKKIQEPNIPNAKELAFNDSLLFLSMKIDVAEQRVLNIEEELEDSRLELNLLPDKIRRFKNLLDRKANLSGTNIFLIEKLKEIELIHESSQPGIRVIVYPIEEFEKVSPNVSQSLMLSLFLGLIGSTVLLFLIEYFNNSIKTIEDLERYGLNILAIIPSIGSVKNKKERKINLNDNKNVGRTLITREDPRSPISEAYRTLRTSIMYSMVDGDNAKTIMVSSPGPGEGKTTTVSNLAITYANLGKKTLLIDADLRKPIIDKVFDLDKDKGLTSYIVGNSSINDIIQKTEIDNLEIISSGITPPNPSELLNSDKMGKLIDGLKLKYDVILIDTPPMIAVTDALVLSKIVDNFILVCRSDVTQKGALDRSIKSLKQVGGKFDGSVLNAISEGNNYGSGYYYNYYQYYYNEDDK